MRKETDEFDGINAFEDVQAWINDDGSVGIYAGYNIKITKQQAREFAKQILEMTGDEDE